MLLLRGMCRQGSSASGIWIVAKCAQISYRLTRSKIRGIPGEIASKFAEYACAAMMIKGEFSVHDVVRVFRTVITMTFAAVLLSVVIALVVQATPQSRTITEVCCFYIK